MSIIADESPDARNAIAARLRVCRERFGYSLRDLEAKTGIKAGHLGDVHNGKKAATLNVLDKLAPLYRTTIAWLRYGKPEVQVLAEFQAAPDYDELSAPTTSRAKRAGSILQFLAMRYPGHLRPEDHAAWGISQGLILGIVNGNDPVDNTVKLISQVSGIPESWIQHGANIHATVAAITALDGRDLDQLMKIGTTWKEHGKSIDQLAAIINAMLNS